MLRFSAVFQKRISVFCTATVLYSRGVHLSRDEGLSPELGGFTEYGGSISAFVKPKGDGQGSRAQGAEPLPCAEDETTVEAAKARCMAEIARTGKLPSPRDVVGKPPQGYEPPPIRREISSQGHTKLPSSLPRRIPTPIVPPLSTTSDAQSSTAGINEPENAVKVEDKGLHTKEAEDYYRAVPRNALSKEEMWQRITSAATDREERVSSALRASDADYLKMEEELREEDLFHFRIGELAFPDTTKRRNYYAMWQLAMSLNKARWTMLDVHSQRGVKTTGAGMKLLFWKEAVNQIMEKRCMTAGQFTDSHPVLRPFAAAVEHNPHMTKAFVRGFTEARLRVLQQPGNVKQLFDHFDRYYGYFFNSLLEILHVKDEHTEHLMQHIGRAIGLTQHCVMFWKKYARIGFTMLPADLCADNHVNLALLRNISLASRDRAVRRLLYDVMCIVKTEMLHAQEIAPQCSPLAWPVVMECTYANYYLGFLQRRDFNVSAMFADNNIENAGFAWYRVKKRWEWEKYQSIERLVAEAAPLPLIGTSWHHRGSSYKVASGIGRVK
ncbi:putative Squalene phytoene synthase [Trypanosoma vivax]|nr:hypothetical protein TRVL_05949 [Trypanosoma vivax]KAH8608005.1 putative Squalene phytoene synthase [Trypanosoma vivax]